MKEGEDVGSRWLGDLLTFVWKDLGEPEAVGCLHIRELVGETDGGNLRCKPPFELGPM